MDCSLPGSSVHGISQARILEWVVISFYKGSSQPRDWTCISFVSCIGRQILYHWTIKEALKYKQVCISNDYFVHVRTYYFFSYFCCSRDIHSWRGGGWSNTLRNISVIFIWKKVPSGKEDDLGNLEIWILVRKLVKELPWWANGWDSMLPIQEVWVGPLVRELYSICYN